MNDETGSAGLKGSIEILSGKENATIQFHQQTVKNNRGVNLSFKGRLNQSTVMKIIDDAWFPMNTLSGEFNLFYPIDKNSPLRMAGGAEIENPHIKLENNGAFLLDSVLVIGRNDFADLKTGDLTIIRPDSLKGLIKKKLTLKNLATRVYFQYNDVALLKILAGNICDLNIRGELNVPSNKLNFTLKYGEKERLTFDDLFTCLGLKEKKISGTVKIVGKLKGTANDLSGSRFHLRATDGSIKKAELLSKILSLIDLTEIFKKNPVKILQGSGYQYDDIDVDAVIEDKKLKITRAKLNGSGLNLYGTGTIDLETHDIDMVILASPLKTIDKLINKIPIVGEKITGKNKSILSVPIKVEGKLDKPKTRFLPKAVSSVSSDVIDAFVKTFKLPFKLSHKILSPAQPNEKTSD